MAFPRRSTLGPSTCRHRRRARLRWAATGRGDTAAGRAVGGAPPPGEARSRSGPPSLGAASQSARRGFRCGYGSKMNAEEMQACPKGWHTQMFHQEEPDFSDILSIYCIDRSIG